MRRALEIISVLFLLAGLEFAAGTLSHTIGRIEETIRFVFAGESLVAPAPVFVVGCVLIVFGVTLGFLTFWAKAQNKVIQGGHDCPRCGTSTIRLKRRARHKLLAVLLGHRITHRRCGRCSWAGLSLKH